MGFGVCAEILSLPVKEIYCFLTTANYSLIDRATSKKSNSTWNYEAEERPEAGSMIVLLWDEELILTQRQGICPPL